MRGGDSSGAPRGSQTPAPPAARWTALAAAVLLFGAIAAPAQETPPTAAPAQAQAAPQQGAPAQGAPAQAAPQQAAPAQAAPQQGAPQEGVSPTAGEDAAKPHSFAEWQAMQSGKGGPGAPTQQKAEARPAVDAARAARSAGRSAAAPPAPVAPAPPVTPVEAEAVDPLAAPISAAAQAYAAKAREVLSLELQVQAYELNTLGREDPETLQGYRKTRRLRIEKDKSFRSLAGQFSIKPLPIPDPGQAPGSSPAALKFFAGLQRAYETTRALRPLEQMHQDNQTFLKSQDLIARDRATGIRDELIDRGVMFTQLAQRAWDIRNGTLGDDAIPELLATLHAQVPEPDEKDSDLAVLVLGNPELRAHVLGEVTSLLSVPLPQPAVLPPGEELTGLVVEQQKSLLEKAGLTAVVEQEQQLADALDKVNAELETAASKPLLDKKVKIVTRRDELRQQWYSTDPDPELYATLADSQEQLIRRRMLDLGTAGALFGARLDGNVAERETIDGTPYARWSFLQDQRDLLNELDAAKPAATPLDNLLPPPLYGLDLLEKAKKEQAAKLGKLGKGGGKGGKNALYGKGKGIGSFGKSASKPTQHPKGKAGAGKGKGAGGKAGGGKPGGGKSAGSWPGMKKKPY